MREERENERTNYFINEGNRINTILFFRPALRQKQREREKIEKSRG